MCMVVGYVGDDDGVPIAGVRLEYSTGYEGYSGMTDSDGCFMVEVPMNVDGKWDIRADGYEDSTEKATYTQPANEANFYLNPRS